jgi:hypothetical protein
MVPFLYIIYLINFNKYNLKIVIVKLSYLHSLLYPSAYIVETKILKIEEKDILLIRR